MLLDGTFSNNYENLSKLNGWIGYVCVTILTSTVVEL